MSILTLRNLGQRTQTDKYSTEMWNCNEKRFAPHTHYRMASVEVGYPLSTFRGTRELIHGGRCAYMGESDVILCGLILKISESFLGGI